MLDLPHQNIIFTGLQGSELQSMAYVPKYGQYGSTFSGNNFGANPGRSGVMPPLSWDQLENESNAVMGSGRKGAPRRGNGTRSTYANNGEFDGSSSLAHLEGGMLPPPQNGKPRALFVSKDGSPVLTWNEIEQITMDDLNKAMGTFNPGANPSNEKRQDGRTFRGFRKGNGNGFVDATKSGGLVSFGGRSNSVGAAGASPLQSKRVLRGGSLKQNGVKPRQPSARK